LEGTQRGELYMRTPRVRPFHAMPDRTKKGAPPKRARGGSPASLDGDAAEANARERLLESTAVLLRARGIASLSLREVARHAGVSHGAPGYHFQSKSGLLTAFAANGFQRLGIAMAAALGAASDDPREQLAAIGKAYIRFAIDEPERFGLMFRRDMHASASSGLEEASSQVFAVLATTLGKASDAGLLARSNIASASAAAWAIAHGLAVLIIEERIPARISDAAPRKVAGSAIDFFVDAILPRRRR
jgi:AcrR family transcriptional regulator